MSHANPFLTIAIPTYNRAEILNKNLSLFIDELDDDVEVLVSDNASSDDTENICKTYRDNHSKFSYFRNSKNLGYDQNVLNCVARSSGSYVWFLGDDDFLDPALIKVVVEALKKENPDGALVNATVINPLNNKIIIDNLSGCSDDFLVHVDSNQFVIYSKWATLISSLIVRRSLIELEFLSAYVGSCFVQVPLFWRAINGGSLYVLGSKKIVKNDATTDNFEMHSSKIWLVNWIETINSLDDIFTRSKCREAALNLYPKPFYRVGSLCMHVVQARAAGIIEKSNKNIILNGVNLNNFERYLIEIIVSISQNTVLSVFSSSRKVARIFRSIWRKFNREQ